MDSMQTNDTALRRRIMEEGRLLFQQQGFDHTSLKDVTTRLDLSEGTVATFFPTIDHLLEAVWSE